MICKTQKNNQKMGVGKENTSSRWNGESKMDEDYVENVWTPLREAIQLVLKKKVFTRTDDIDDSFDYMYKTAYIMVNDNHAKSLYVGVKEVITDHLEAKVLPVVLKSLNNNFLKTINSAWLDHQVSLEMVADILLYLDR